MGPSRSGEGFTHRWEWVKSLWPQGQNPGELARVDSAVFRVAAFVSEVKFNGD